MPPAPHPPLQDWTIQFFDPRFGYAWYCGQGVIVSQTTVSHGTEESTHTYHDFESAMLQEHAADIERHGGLYVIHDWRSLTGHDSAGRRAWQARMRERETGYLRGSVVCLVKAPPLLKMAIQAVNVYASVTYGAKVEISTDLERELQRHGVVAPRVA